MARRQGITGRVIEKRIVGNAIERDRAIENSRFTYRAVLICTNLRDCRVLDSYSRKCRVLFGETHFVEQVTCITDAVDHEEHVADVDDDVAALDDIEFVISSSCFPTSGRS